MDGKHHLNIDIETYSSIPIASAGVYRYVESDDFEIMLVAYSLDGREVKIIDLAQGEDLPDWFLNALFDDTYVKHAYNAAFELACFSRHSGWELPGDQWRCTMVHGLYCGFPAGLGAIGDALGLSHDDKKLATGKALVRYFCSPCRPTKTNGGRTRNLPRHDPPKWEAFKEYCKQDVVTERVVAERLSCIPLPRSIQEEWVMDLAINRRGVAVDMAFVRAALALGGATREHMMAEATKITGLANPNSVSQLKGWIEGRVGYNIADLRKETVRKLMDSELPTDVKRVLAIRQELGKTSTKKYNAIEDTVGDDGRVRGLLQFYGANRTGRWAGRLVQVQNLPRTYIEPLDLARELVKTEQGDALRCVYGPVSDTLSQLIRTAFVAPKDAVFIDADFSAIEARVIAWLAGEQWRLDTFQQGGDIYCASASQMFGVPVEKHGVNSHLRQKGKVAELALGYQGSAPALIAMGALEMGLREDELPDIVSRWRATNERIVSLWWDMDQATKAAVENGVTTSTHYVNVSMEFPALDSPGYLVIKLPSGRKLYYYDPAITTNRFDQPSVSYVGQDRTSKQWGRLETYGGRFVENVVQAIARDCLATAITRLERKGYKIVFHVHDEVVIEASDRGFAEEMLDDVVNIMTEPIPWAQGLPLAADGWVGRYFKKD